MGKLIEIAGFYDPEEAYCAKGLLQSYGIEAIIQNEHHLAAAPWLRVALGGYRLLILSEMAADANRILASVNAPSQKFGDDRKVNIGRQRQSTRTPRNWFWAPIAFASGIPFVPPQKTGWIGLSHTVALILLYTMFIALWGLSFPR